MKYIFDANVLIRSSRIDFEKDKDELNDFLNWIFSLIKSGVIMIPERVYDEILDGDDLLAEWCKKDVKKYKTDDSVAAPCLPKVLEAYEAEDAKTIEKIQNDAFIIAHALACGGTVVTYEKESKATSAINKKIPNICEKLGIPCITLPTFIWRLKRANS